MLRPKLVFTDRGLSELFCFCFCFCLSSLETQRLLYFRNTRSNVVRATIQQIIIWFFIQLCLGLRTDLGVDPVSRETYIALCLFGLIASRESIYLVISWLDLLLQRELSRVNTSIWPKPNKYLCYQPIRQGQFLSGVKMVWLQSLFILT